VIQKGHIFDINNEQATPKRYTFLPQQRQSQAFWMTNSEFSPVLDKILQSFCHAASSSL